MFGKPQWFVLKTWGWGVHPVTRQGWIWLGVWLAVILTPYLAFLSTNQFVEGFTWLGCLSAAMIYDVRLIVAAIQRGPQAAASPQVGTPPSATAKPAPAAKKSDVLYIGDEPTPEELATKRFDLRLQR